MKETKILLRTNEMPQKWYNILSDFPGQIPPPINPATKKPLAPEDLKAIFPMGLIMQEASNEKWIDIPNEITEVLKIWRPTPLIRAIHLEKALKTNARIYYKNESVSPAGSHKLNTAIAQAYFNKIEGIKNEIIN